MKQKKLLIILSGVLVLCALGVVGFFLLGKSSNTPTQPVAQQNQVVPTLKPEDIGLDLSMVKSGKFAGNGVDMKITKIGDISSIDYELSYVSKGDIPRGAIGHVDVKPGDSQIDQQLAFGTCSDVCHFDTEVHDVKMTLKVTKTDGKSYQVEAPFQLPQ